MASPILYCILVHDRPAQVKRLIRALWNAFDIFVIHVDQKSGPNVHAAVGAFAGETFDNIHVIPSRVCAWGGASLVLATLDMLALGLTLGADWSHAVLLSGTHLPLWPSHRIRDWFVPGRSVIRFVDATTEKRERILFESREIAGKGMLRLQRLGEPDFAYRVGSQWVALARQHVQFVVDHREGEMSRRLLQSEIPDEAYFQTVLFASPHREQRVSEWTTFSRFVNGACQLLTLDDYRRLASESNLPFARKFPENLGDEQDVLDAVRAATRAPLLVDPSRDAGAMMTAAVDARYDPAIKVAIVYRTRNVGGVPQREIDRLKKQLPEFSVFAVCYERNYKHATDSVPGQKYCYGEIDIKELPYPNKLSDVGWTGMTSHHDLPVLRFFREHPEFDRYWVIEDDVRYSGEWSGLFTTLEKSRADLLMTVIECRKEMPDWYWWQSLVSGDDVMPNEKMFKGFGPFTRLSAACLTAIDQKYRDGWAGHFETTWPTIAMACGLTIEDIGGEGSYVPADRRGQFYTCSPRSWALFPGTFVFRPPFHDTGVSEFGKDILPQPMLWHPVKFSETTVDNSANVTQQRALKRDPASPAAVDAPSAVGAPAEEKRGFITAREQMVQGASAIDVVNAAIACRDQGRSEVAAQMLHEIIEVQPFASPAYYELAFLHRLKGEHRDAAKVLAQSLRNAGTDLRTQLFLAHMLHALGAHAEAVAILDSAEPTTESETVALAAMFELGAYLRAYPIGRALFMLEELKALHRYVETHEAATIIEEALRERDPFALVRLGDGEGACLTLGPSDEHRHQQLYNRNRSEFTEIWFGSEFSLHANGFLRLARGLLEEVAGCDLLGIPYRSWIEHEYAICSPRGIPSLVNIFRRLLADPPAGRLLCSQNVAVDLHASGLLAPILRKERRLSIVTSIVELPELLQQTLGLEEVRLYRIPGERGSAISLGPEAVDCKHYPAVFQQLQFSLSEPHEGRLFLVAGGVLGKLYIATIRQHGGIALDIGSLADAWTGRYTRPSYDERLKL